MLLTLHFDHCALMMAYLLDSKGAQGVEAVFDAMENALGTLQFLQLAELMLPKKLLAYFHLTRIPPDEVILTPALLKK